MQPSRPHIPALPVASGLCVGIALYALSGHIIICILVTVSATAICYSLGTSAGTHCALCAMAGSILAYASQPAAPDSSIYGRPCLIEAEVVDVSQTGRTLSCILDVKQWIDPDSGFSAKASFRLNLSISGADRRYMPGQHIIAATTIEPLSAPSIVPDHIDYSHYLDIDGITARAFAMNSDITFLAYDPDLLQRIATKGSDALSDAIVKSGVKPATASFLLAIIAGDDSLMSDNTRLDLRTAGIAHIMAISGMHLAILVWMMSVILIFVRALPGGRHIYLITLGAAAWVYALITGMSPSVCRAAVMVSVFLLARLLQRRPSPYNSLCVTVVVWLIINPMWIFSPGFQLSVIAVAAIIYANSIITSLNLSSWAAHTLSLTAVPAIVMCAVAPLSVIYFHEFPLWFLPANIIGSILIGPIFVIGLVLSAFSALCITIPAGVWIEDTLYGILAGVADMTSSLPYARLTGLYPSAAHLTCYIIAMIFAVVAINRRRYAYGLISAIWMGILISISTISIPVSANELYLTADTSDGIMLFHSAGRGVIQSSAPDADTTDVNMRARTLYRDYAGRRSITSWETPAADFDIGDISRRGDIIFFEDKTLRIIDSDSAPAYSQRVNYALIRRGFRGDIASLLKRVNADTLLIGADINTRRRLRYLEEISSTGQPVRSVAPAGFALVSNTYR